jgi:hypothetical protein
MTKWIGPILSLFLVLSLVLVTSPFGTSKKTAVKKEGSEKPRIVLTQDADEKKVTPDPMMLQIWKLVQEKLDSWLKSLNERIESEDITRFEVRFLEVLRNILSWVKEKVDAKVAEGEEEKKNNPEPKGKKGSPREVRTRDWLPEPSLS